MKCPVHNLDCQRKLSPFGLHHGFEYWKCPKGCWIDIQEIEKGEKHER